MNSCHFQNFLKDIIMIFLGMLSDNSPLYFQHHHLHLRHNHLTYQMERTYSTWMSRRQWLRTKTAICEYIQFCVGRVFLKFLKDTSPFHGGHWYPCFQSLETSALGFKARVDSLAHMRCYLCATDSSYSPLVQHFLASWQPAWQPSHSIHILADL